MVTREGHTVEGCGPAGWPGGTATSAAPLPYLSHLQVCRVGGVGEDSIESEGERVDGGGGRLDGVTARGGERWKMEKKV